MDACNYKISDNNEINKTGSSIGAPFFACIQLERYELIKSDEVKQTNTACALRSSFGVEKNHCGVACAIVQIGHRWG